MGRTLYLECYSGISGDMIVGALLDLGADEEKLRKALASLPLDGYSIQISRVKKSGLLVCDFDVQLDAAHENHDHDMAYLYGQMSVETSDTDTHPHQHAHHEHRNLEEITRIIRAADLSPKATQYALKIFGILAEAEAQVHGTSVEQVHFHEVGAVDSIVDIVAAAVCLDMLDVSEVIIPDLTEGRGCVRCQHGVIPVPVPAVLAITKRYGIALRITGIDGEMVTPTGAAFCAAVRTGTALPEHMQVVQIGMGAGKRVYPNATGILRALIITE